MTQFLFGSNPFLKSMRRWADARLTEINKKSPFYFERHRVLSQFSCYIAWLLQFQILLLVILGISLTVFKPLVKLMFKNY